MRKPLLLRSPYILCMENDLPEFESKKSANCLSDASFLTSLRSMMSLRSITLNNFAVQIFDPMACFKYVIPLQGPSHHSPCSSDCPSLMTLIGQYRGPQDRRERTLRGSGVSVSLPMRQEPWRFTGRDSIHLPRPIPRALNLGLNRPLNFSLGSLAQRGRRGEDATGRRKSHL